MWRCAATHWCMCGHLAHGRHEEVSTWVVEGMLYFGLLVAAVVGLRGGFRGAFVSGICAALAVFANFLAGRVGELLFWPFMLIGVLHTIIGLRRLFSKLPAAGGQCCSRNEPTQNKSCEATGDNVPN